MPQVLYLIENQTQRAARVVGKDDRSPAQLNFLSLSGRQNTRRRLVLAVSAILRISWLRFRPSVNGRWEVCIRIIMACFLCSDSFRTYHRSLLYLFGQTSSEIRRHMCSMALEIRSNSAYLVCVLSLREASLFGDTVSSVFANFVCTVLVSTPSFPSCRCVPAVLMQCQWMSLLQYQSTLSLGV